MTDQFAFTCNRCQKVTVRDNLDEFKCLCQSKPIGMKYYFHCLQCSNYYWGSSQAECTQCIAGRLSEKKVSFEPIGDMKNVPRRDPDKEQRSSDLAYEKILEAKKQAQITTDLAQRSTIETASLLRELNKKLDSILERREFEC